MTTQIQPLLDALQNTVSEVDVVRKSCRDDDLSGIPAARMFTLLTSLRAGIERIGSEVHTRQAIGLARSNYEEHFQILALTGVARSLLDDAKLGLLRPLVELIHGELFADFLDMAQHLVDEGYKDPAAVVAGSALESHLRQLCGKHSISPVQADGRPKKADTLNSELAVANVYSKSDLKSVTAWLGQRNDAAHGHYSNYTAEQVKLHIAAIRDFVTRVPA